MIICMYTCMLDETDPDNADLEKLKVISIVTKFSQIVHSCTYYRFLLYVHLSQPIILDRTHTCCLFTCSTLIHVHEIERHSVTTKNCK